MTDKELIQSLRSCATGAAECEDCPMPDTEDCYDQLKKIAADRLEALTAANHILSSEEAEQAWKEAKEDG